MVECFVFLRPLGLRLFYTFNLEVPRLSDAKDILSVTVSERLIGGMELKAGSEVIVEGQLRSYNKFVDGANRLILSVFARNVEFCIEKSKNPNQIFLDGYMQAACLQDNSFWKRNC